MRNYIHWDTWYEKAFKLTKAPVEGCVSVVTPLNGDAWVEWDKAPYEVITHFKNNWNEIQKTLSDNKYYQIIESMK